MKEDADIYIHSDKLEILRIDQIKFEAKEPDIFICDEFDYMLEHQPVFFGDADDNHALFGLAPVYHGNRVYFLSATFDSYHKKLLQ